MEGVVADRKKPDLAVTQSRTSEHVRPNYTGEPTAPPVRPLPRGFEYGANYPEAPTLEGLADIPWPLADPPTATLPDSRALRDLADQPLFQPTEEIQYLAPPTPPSKVVTSVYHSPTSSPNLPGPTHGETELGSPPPEDESTVTTEKRIPRGGG